MTEDYSTAISPDLFKRIMSLESSIVDCLKHERQSGVCIAVLVRILNQFIRCQDDPEKSMEHLLNYIPQAYKDDN